MRTLTQSILALTAVIIAGCGSGGGDDSGTTKPVAAALIAPVNNSECITASSVSATESNVTFEWNAADNADSYVLYVKNLKTQSQVQYNASGNVSLTAKLLKGVPYSWYVTSKSNGSQETSNSDTWKFYNAGEGVSSYIPFPADVIAPDMSSAINGPTVTLQWTTTDLDNDIVNYKVYMDANSNPTTLKGTVTTQSLSNVAINTGTMYYWKVITTDATGNTSESPVFQFRTF